MTSVHRNHQLTAAHVRRNRSSSTQTQVKRRNGRLTGRSTVRVASTRSELRPGTAIAVELSSETPSNSSQNFTHAHPPSEFSLGESDTGFDWSREASSDFPVEDADHLPFRINSLPSVASATKRVRVSLAYLFYHL